MLKNILRSVLMVMNRKHLHAKKALNHLQKAFNLAKNPFDKAFIAKKIQALE